MSAQDREPGSVELTRKAPAHCTIMNQPREPMDTEDWVTIPEAKLHQRVKELYDERLQRQHDFVTEAELLRGALLGQREREREKDILTRKMEPVGRDYCLSRVPANLQSSGTPDQGGNPVLVYENYFLTDTEIAAYNAELAGELKSLPKSMWYLILTCAMGAVVQGWSQESINGANLDWPRELSIGHYDTDKSVWVLDTDGKWKFAMVNAAPYFAAGLLGPILSDPIADTFGRRTALILAAISSLSSVLAAIKVPSWGWLLCVRVLQGLGIGAKASIIPLVESEVAPKTMRGRLLISWQTSVAFGLFAGSIANIVLIDSWRGQICAAAIPAFFLLCLATIMPETPQWLVRRYMFEEAFKNLHDIRPTKLQAARDIYVLWEQVREEAKEYRTARWDNPVIPKPQFKWFGKICRLFTETRNKTAVVSSWLVMASQQTSGINIFALLATATFAAANLSKSDNLRYNLLFAGINTVASLVTYLFVDRTSRRRLLLWSLLATSMLLYATGPVLKKAGELSSSSDSSPSQKAILVLVVLHATFYSFGAGIIPFLYSSEVFPLKYRETGMASACFVNFELAGVVALIVSLYLSPDDGIGPPEPDTNQQVFFGFASVNMVLIGLLFFFMRSSEKASLEEINARFSPALKWHPIYQWRRIKHMFSSKEDSDHLNTSFISWYRNRLLNLATEVEGNMQTSEVANGESVVSRSEGDLDKENQTHAEHLENVQGTSENAERSI